MALMTVELYWKDAGSLGRMGRGDKEGISISMPANSWKA